MSDCTHRQIRAWPFADDGSVAPLWSCADCGAKFAPVDIAQEDDARRYRWLRSEDETGRVAEFWKMACLDYALTLEPLDAAIDAAMKAAHG